MNTNDVARVAALVGEPARTAMLLELMDGRALTANELARAGSVTPQTASKHLAQLVAAGLLTVTQTGRHRYHRLASSQVANMLESIMQLAALPGLPARARTRRVLPGPKDEDLRRARTCYDHLAGRLGVAIADRLQELGAVVVEGDGALLTDRAEGVLQELGIRSGALPAVGPRVQCRPCLDWSERRPHLAGRLGSLLCAHCLASGWLRRRKTGRSLEVTATGALHLGRWLGAARWRFVEQGLSAAPQAGNPGS